MVECYHNRVKFQKRLRSDRRSNGHQHWINGLDLGISYVQNSWIETDERMNGKFIISKKQQKRKRRIRKCNPNWG